MVPRTAPGLVQGIPCLSFKEKVTHLLPLPFLNKKTKTQAPDSAILSRRGK